MENTTLPPEIICNVSMTQTDMHALLRIRNYFGAHDKTQIEHLAYDVLSRVTKGHSLPEEKDPF